MNTMDRGTILEHSRNFRLYNRVNSNFIDVLIEFCNKKGYPEHVEGLLQIINSSILGTNCIDLILQEFEKEYKLIQLTNLKTNKIIHIW